MESYRKYLKNQILPGMSEDETDQMKGLPLPPIQKPYPLDDFIGVDGDDEIALYLAPVGKV